MKLGRLLISLLFYFLSIKSTYTKIRKTNVPEWVEKAFVFKIAVQYCGNKNMIPWTLWILKLWLIKGVLVLKMF